MEQPPGRFATPTMEAYGVYVTVVEGIRSGGGKYVAIKGLFEHCREAYNKDMRVDRDVQKVLAPWFGRYPVLYGKDGVLIIGQDGGKYGAMYFATVIIKALEHKFGGVGDETRNRADSGVYAKPVGDQGDRHEDCGTVGADCIIAGGKDGLAESQGQDAGVRVEGSANQGFVCDYRNR